MKIKIKMNEAAEQADYPTAKELEDMKNLVSATNVKMFDSIKGIKPSSDYATMVRKALAGMFDLSDALQKYDKSKLADN